MNGADSLPPNYPHQYVTDLVLRDGSTIRVRPISSADRGRWLAFVDRVSEESWYLRMVGPKKRHSDEEVAHYINLDYASRMALAATLGREEQERIVAITRYDQVPGTRRAEVAILVEDSYQGRGIGTAMLEYLASIGRAHGIDAFEADVLVRNERMVRVFEGLGYDVDRSYSDSDMVHVAFPLQDTDRARRAAEDRERIATRASMRAIFEPSGVAVVGASRNERSVGGALFRNLIHHNFQGFVHPVNPNTTAVAGVRAYRSVMDAPGQFDLVVIVVPARIVADVIRECAARQVKAVCVISAGFAEAGEDGEDLQDELVELCRANGIRLVGPNCLGVLNTDPKVRMNATFAPTFALDGNVAMSSQSGALGLAILDYSLDLGLGISSFASLGNGADISPTDLLQYWETDDRTQVIVLYVESFGDPQKLARIARRVSQTKPIVAVKSGRTAVGARAAASHSAALAQSDVAVEALFRQTGVIRTDTMHELFDVANALSHQPIPQGRRVAIITNGGGPGILCADACSSHGLEVTEPSAELMQAMREYLPPHAAVSNPIDMIAAATPEQYERTVKLIGCSGQFDAMIVIYIPVMVTEPEEIAAAIVAGSQDCNVPVLSCFMSSRGVPEAFSAAGEQIPSYRFPEEAARALARAVEYGEFRMRPPGQVPEFTDVNIDLLCYLVDGALRGGGGWAAPETVDRMLEAAGVSVAKAKLAKSPDDLPQMVDELAPPYAVKLVSDVILHKSDVGGVRLNVPDADGLKKAFAEIQSAVAKTGQADAFQGVIVQEMAKKGVEVAMGVVQHETFGSLVMLGTGGVMLELFRDVTFRVHPLTDVDASDMIRGLKLEQLLRGYRGEAPKDRQALESLLLRLSCLVEEVPEIAELDLNPVIVHDEGQGATVVDARIRLAPADEAGAVQLA